MPGTIAVATIRRIRPKTGTGLFLEAMPDLQLIAAAGLTDRFVFTGIVVPDAVPEPVRSLSLPVAPPRHEGLMD